MTKLNTVNKPDVNVVIEFQSQPTEDSCMSACMAMITGLPVSQVVEEFHVDYYVRGATTPDQYLISKNVDFSYEPRDAYTHIGSIKPDTTYLLQVPAIGHVDDTHAIIIQTYGNPSKGEYEIYDPMQGKSDTYYGNGEVDLRCWNINLIITRRNI